VSRRPRRPNHCNVVAVAPGRRKLWRFNISGKGKTTLVQEFTELPEENMPAKVVGKGWADLRRPRLNLAWLPSDRVFLRVVEFPVAEPDELRTMIELQLEKLSPLPLSQTIWTFEPLPAATGGDGAMQPVLLIIAARQEVVRFLGQLEQTGFLADRLELPELHQLLAAHKAEDGVWFIPRTVSESSASVLIAWWYGGTLRNLTAVNLTSSDNWEEELKDQLAQIAWGGEMDGWLTGEPHFHLLGDTATADAWKPVLERVTGDPVTVDEPLPAAQLAGLAARKAASRETRANLAPADLLDTYRQKFIDSIWMRGLGAIVMCYLFGILIYFGLLEVLKNRRNELNGQVYALSGAYTNALMTKARIAVLQEQIALKYAALESLRAASEKLPEGVVLTDFTFSQGKRVTLRGTVPAADITKVTTYNEELGGIVVEDRKLFRSVGPPAMGGGVGGAMTWSFSLELDSPEI
jgi:hypothetical protein